RSLAITVQPVRDVFFEHRVEIGATETEGAQARASHAIGRDCPRLQGGVDIKWGAGEINVRVGMLAVHAGREHLVTQRQCGFQQSRRAGRAFEMAEIRLDRSQSYRTGRKMESTQRVG